MKILLQYILLSSLILLSRDHSYAQKHGQAKIDSMLQDLHNAKEDTNKVKVLYYLSMSYSIIGPDEGLKYASQALDLAKKLGWEKGMATANSALGSNYMVKSDSNAIKYLQESLRISTKINDKVNMGAAIMNIGNVYFGKSDYKAAMENYLNALKIFEECGNKLKVKQVTGNLGVVYSLLGDYPKALEYDLKALKMNEEEGNKQGIAMTTGNIGTVYQSRKDFPKALEYYFKQLKIEEEVEDKDGIARVCGNIGGVYLNQVKYKEALEYELRAVKIYEEIGNKMGLATVSSDVGELYGHEKKYELAIQYLLNTVKITEEIGNRELEAGNLCNVGMDYLAMADDTGMNKSGDERQEMDSVLQGLKYNPEGAIPKTKTQKLNKAIDFLQRSLAISTEIHTPGQMQNCYQYLAEAYMQTGDYKKAAESTNDYYAIKDSLFSKENDEKILKMQLNYEFDKKTADAEKASALKLQRQRSYTYMGFAGISLLLVFAFFMTRNNKLLSKEKKRSDDLLLNILPAEVATELKDKGTAAAKYFDHVTVLFTDFVNFTNASERFGPQGLIDELHACFKKFDEIAGKYNIEKIKTIGDAYLAVCGLPAADPKHAENIVNAAIEIDAFIQGRIAKLGDKTFQVRIGIHSGSVVAGIVGVKKFAYDIWGDTVNTAARMEQNSAPGKINISETTFELVKDKFTCEYRGEIDAKNKGKLKMYFVS